DGGRIRRSGDIGSRTPSPGMASEHSRHWRDVFWLGVFVVHLILLGVFPVTTDASSHRLPFTMLVLQEAVKLVWSLPEVMRVSYVFMLVMLLWMVIWSFGAAGVVAMSLGDGGSCGRQAASMPPKPLAKSLRHAVTTSFGSICYGALFTAAIRTMRWKVQT
ncbi:hypothetical protein IFM89_031600, partial [Coptis chinensis]